MTNVLTNLIEVTILQYIHVSSHHSHTPYTYTVLYVYCISLQLEREREEGGPGGRKEGGKGREREIKERKKERGRKRRRRKQGKKEGRERKKDLAEVRGMPSVLVLRFRKNLYAKTKKRGTEEPSTALADSRQGSRKLWPQGTWFLWQPEWARERILLPCKDPALWTPWFGSVRPVSSF